MTSRLGLVGEGSEKLDVVGIGKGPRQRVRQHHPDGACPASAQRARRRVRPAVVETGGSLEDPGTQFVGREKAFDTVVRETPTRSAMVCSVTVVAMG